MCDTLVAAGRATRNNTVIFAKNSDRPPNEAQPLVYMARTSHEPSAVRCQNITIPQVEVTYRHIGSQPYWLWGYEHGLNEWGVAIGNLGVWSKEPFEEPGDTTGLLGMDLVRLGLERSCSARDALAIITRLLMAYGAGYATIGGDQGAKYHNNYLIADAVEAWNLQTAGRYWVANRIVDSVDHIGNMYTIQTKWDVGHPQVIDHAIDQGWCTSSRDFNFARVYGDYACHPVTRAMIRVRRGLQLLRQQRGQITCSTMMRFLRDHLEGTFLASEWTPGEHFYATLCVHEQNSDQWWSGQTAASMIVELRQDIHPLFSAECWVSMTAPYTSVFLPLYPRHVTPPRCLSLVGPQQTFQASNNTFMHTSPWWLFKRLQRHTEQHYTVLGAHVQQTWHALETQIQQQRVAIEQHAQHLLNNDAEAEAHALIQRFVNESVATALDHVKQLNQQLTQLRREGPSYDDLRQNGLNVLNQEAHIKF
jgi:dipeptidase